MTRAIATESRPSARARAAAERARSALGDRNAAFDDRWLRALSGASRERVDAVRAELAELVPYEQRIRAEQRAGGRSYYAQFRAPLELYALVRLLAPDHIIETGVSSGVSSTHFLLGLRENGRGTLHSIDLPLSQRGSRFSSRESPVVLPPGRQSGWAMPPELRAGWDLRIGPSEKVLPALVDELPSVRIFLHDSKHTPAHLLFELRTVRPKLSRGAVVIADNTVWTGAAFPRFAREVGAPVRRRRRSDLVALTVP
jgi:predicted O-methyltransferase YrrM